MHRCFALVVIVCLACFTLAQNPALSLNPIPQPSSSPVQVVYVIENSTLYIYNINAQTLQATQVGTSNLPQSLYGGVTASPNGKFLYYTQFSGNSEPENLYVYQTNGSCVPNLTSVQTPTVTRLQGFVFDPISNFVYASFDGPQGFGFVVYGGKTLNWKFRFQEFSE